MMYIVISVRIVQLHWRLKCLGLGIVIPYNHCIGIYKLKQVLRENVMLNVTGHVT